MITAAVKPPLGASEWWGLSGAAAGAFTLADQHGSADAAIVTAVTESALLRFAASVAETAPAAMLVIAGGGYTRLMIGREGVQVARWLNGLGIDAYLLIHRFPGPADDPSTPLSDAAAAMSVIATRGHSAIGVLGLSSGGHLAAALLAEPPGGWSIPPVRRPDVAIIGYAPISTNAAGRTVVPNKPPLEPAQKQALYDLLQPDAHLRADPPPTFIAYSANDPVVPVANALRLHQALSANGGSVELHVLADAPHGFALDTTAGPVTQWPALCAAWLRQAGFLPPA